MIEIIFSFFSLFYVFFLPGWVCTWLFLKKTGRLTRFLIGLGLSIIIIPLLSFSVAMFIGTFVNPALILSLATSINIIGLIIILLKRLKN